MLSKNRAVAAIIILASASGCIGAAKQIEDFAEKVVKALNHQELDNFTLLMSEKDKKAFSELMNMAFDSFSVKNFGAEKFSLATENDEAFGKKFAVTVGALCEKENMAAIKRIRDDLFFYSSENIGIKISDDVFDDKLNKDIVKVLVALEKEDSAAVTSFFEMVRSVGKLNIADSLTKNVAKFFGVIISGSEAIESQFRIAYGSLVALMVKENRIANVVKHMTPRAMVFLLDFINTQIASPEVPFVDRMALARSLKKRISKDVNSRFSRARKKIRTANRKSCADCMSDALRGSCELYESIKKDEERLAGFVKGKNKGELKTKPWVGAKKKLTVNDVFSRSPEVQTTENRSLMDELAMTSGKVESLKKADDDATTLLGKACNAVDKKLTKLKMPRVKMPHIKVQNFKMPKFKRKKNSKPDVYLQAGSKPGQAANKTTLRKKAAFVFQSCFKKMKPKRKQPVGERYQELVNKDEVSERSDEEERKLAVSKQMIGFCEQALKKQKEKKQEIKQEGPVDVDSESVELPLLSNFDLPDNDK